ncbi:MAG: LicD family protein [Eubacteriales bacterium]
MAEEEPINAEGTLLRKLQLCELEILREFVRICTKYELRYFLVGGTLLGAVRHQGFIPWDDDIDVAMLREDYDEFAKIAQVEFGETYFYQDYNTDPHYFLSYAKIRKNGTEVYEERFKNSQFHKGVFIDIFPLDYCPKPSLFTHFLFNVLAVMNYRGQVDSGEEYNPYDELIGKLGWEVLKIFSKSQTIKLRKNLILFGKFIGKQTYIASYSGAYGYKREVFPLAAYDKLHHTLFCEELYSVPIKYDLYLTQIYGGNYMRLPEKSDRHTHINVNFISI